MSAARSFLQSPSLAKQASFMKEKVLEKGTKILARKGSSNHASHVQSGYLTKEEVQFLMDHVKTIILHLRARLLLESKDEAGAYKPCDIFGTQDEQQSKEKALSDARTIRTIAETGPKNLQNALVKFTPKSIAQVIKLVFRSAEVPLLRAVILAEILSLQDAANKNRAPVDIDDLRAVLGKAPARHIDILGQLIALLSMDSAGAQRMAYSWSTVIFFPRYDIKNAATKEYEGFDVGRQMPLTVTVTIMMIEQVAEVFSLDDDEYVKRLGAEIVEIQQADMRLAYEQHMRSMNPVSHSVTLTNNGAATGTKGRPAPKAPTAQTIIGKCMVQYDFQAENKNELDVYVGDECYILEKGTDEWWKVRVIADGREGLVPETYVEEIAWDRVVPGEEEPVEEEPQYDAEHDYYENEENNAMQAQQQHMQEEAPAEPEPEPQEEVIDDKIAELERQLNALKAAAQRNSTKSQVQRAESVESPHGAPVRSTIPSKAFDEVPAAMKSPPAPVTKMAPPPLPPNKTRSVQLKPVPSIPSKPAENQSRATNVASPQIPQRITSAPAVKPAAAGETRVATPMPSRHSVNSSAAGGERPQLDLNAVLKQRMAKISTADQ